MLSSLLVSAALVAAAPGFAAGPAPVPLPVPVDIKAEFSFHSAGSFYVVQIRNVSPTIAGPLRAEYALAIPAGSTVTNWTLNGWQCAPSPPAVGSVKIDCKISLAGAWAAGTILSNQIFVIAVSPGTVRGRACVRARMLEPDPAGVYQPVAESNTANNAACV